MVRSQAKQHRNREGLNVREEHQTERAAYFLNVIHKPHRRTRAGPFGFSLQFRTSVTMPLKSLGLMNLRLLTPLLEKRS